MNVEDIKVGDILYILDYDDNELGYTITKYTILEVANEYLSYVCTIFDINGKFIKNTREISYDRKDFFRLGPKESMHKTMEEAIIAGNITDILE